MADGGGFDFTQVHKNQFRDFHDEWCNIARGYETKAPFLRDISAQVEKEFVTAERLVGFITQTNEDSHATSIQLGQCVRLYERLNKLELKIAELTGEELNRIYELPNHDKSLKQPSLTVHRDAQLRGIIQRMPGSSFEDVAGHAQKLHNELLADGPRSEMRVHAIEAMAAAKEVYDVVGRFKAELKGLFPEGKKRDAFQQGINAGAAR